MPSYTGAGLQNVNTGVHVANTDNFINIHIVMPADFSQFIGKSDINCTVSIFYNFSHFRSTDIRYNDFALAKRFVYVFNFFTN